MVPGLIFCCINTSDYVRLGWLGVLTFLSGQNHFQYAVGSSSVFLASLKVVRKFLRARTRGGGSVGSNAIFEALTAA